MANIPELRNKIFAATGQRISDDDPVFTVAVLNEIVIGDLLREQAQALCDQVTRIETAASYVSTTSQETVDAYTRASVAAKRELEAQAKASATNAQSAINSAVAGLVPAVEKTVAEALAKKIKKINMAEDAISYAMAGLVIGVILGVGIAIGSHVHEQALTGTATWREFTSRVALGFIGSTLSLLLIGAGLGMRNSAPTPGWGAFGLGMAILVYTLLAVSGMI